MNDPRRLLAITALARLRRLQSILYPDQSSRSRRRNWTSEAANYGMEGLLTSYAYCRDEKVKSRSRTASVDSCETETVEASCKPGTKALSGGFDAEPIDDFVDAYCEKK